MQTPIKISSQNNFSSTVTVLCDMMPCNINVSDASASVIFRVDDKFLNVEALCFFKPWNFRTKEQSVTLKKTTFTL